MLELGLEEVHRLRQVLAIRLDGVRGGVFLQGQVVQVFGEGNVHVVKRGQ